jgi:hypothetical protein
MKKLERLNKSLFQELCNINIINLAAIQGGNYEEWTSNKKKETCDTETHTGQKGCNSDDTKADCDVTQTDCKQDHAIAFDPNGGIDSISSPISTSVAF